MKGAAGGLKQYKLPIGYSSFFNVILLSSPKLNPINVGVLCHNVKARHKKWYVPIGNVFRFLWILIVTSANIPIPQFEI